MKKLISLLLCWSALCGAMRSSDLLVPSGDMPIVLYGTEDEAKLHQAASGGNTTVIKSLLGAGTLVDARNSFSRKTALHKGAENGKFDAVVLLICWNACLDLSDVDQETALHMAAEGGHGNVVRLLAACGADVALKDEEGLGVLHRIAREGTPALCEPLFQGMVMNKVFEDAQKFLKRVVCLLLCFKKTELPKFPKGVQWLIIKELDGMSWNVVCAAGVSAYRADSFTVFVQRILKGAKRLGNKRCAEIIAQYAGRLARKACLAPTFVGNYRGQCQGQIPCQIAREYGNDELAKILHPSAIQHEVKGWCDGWFGVADSEPSK